MSNYSNKKEKTSSAKPPATQGGQQKGFIPLKTVKVNPKWHIGERIPCDILTTATLKDSVAIVITNGTLKRELTVHRPIGQTGLSQDDWVITPTSDITDLLARRENPEKARIEEQRRNFVSEELVQMGALVRAPDGNYYYPNWELSRKDCLKEISDRSKSTLGAHVLDNIALEEARINEIKSRHNLASIAIRMIPNVYTTAAGPIREHPQVAAVDLKGCPAASLIDQLTLRLFQSNLQVPGYTPNPVAVASRTVLPSTVTTSTASSVNLVDSRSPTPPPVNPTTSEITKPPPFPGTLGAKPTHDPKIHAMVLQEPPQK